MRFAKRVVGVFFLLLMVETGVSAGDLQPDQDPVVSTSSTDSSVTLKIGGTFGGLQPVRADPLEGCSFYGPVNGTRVRELLDVGQRTITIGARVRPLDDESLYGVVKCDRLRFGDQADAVWPIDENPPGEVIEAVVTSAIARLTIPTPTPRTAPDGNQTPFLVHLPVWLWVDGETWTSQTATAGLGTLNVSATATASPTHTTWNPGDGSKPFRCDDAGTPWQPGLNDAETNCASTYTSVTPPETTLQLSAAVSYGLSITCNPVGLCANIETPTTLQASASRSVRVTEARGVLTG